MDMDLNIAAQLLSQSSDYKVLRRMQERKHFFVDNRPEKLCRGLVCDTETTGITPVTDKIIEVGMVAFEYCPETGRVFDILGTYNGLQDPGIPIPPEASRVNNITDEMVKGKTLDFDTIDMLASGANLVIAHNAGFDRKFIEALPELGMFKQMPWGCSHSQVPWGEEKLPGKLTYLAHEFGFFYDGHRAEIDCRALLEVLQQPLPVSGELGLKHLLNRYKVADIRIWALDSKFETKEILKERGYHWGDGLDGNPKAWNIDVPENQYEAEIAWLKEHIYAKKDFRVSESRIDAFNRFAVRSASLVTTYH